MQVWPLKYFCWDLQVCSDGVVEVLVDGVVLVVVVVLVLFITVIMPTQPDYLTQEVPIGHLKQLSVISSHSES